MSEKWNKKPPPPPPREPPPTETSVYSLSTLRIMDESKVSRLLFDSIRECEIPTVKNILQSHRSLLNAKMFGFEAADIYEVIKNSKTHRCYKYTGVERDGYFYPLHVAAEAGHKRLTYLLVKAGANVNATDYRGDIAEVKCNGDSLYAFYELRGLVFEERERYEGMLDRDGKRTGQGTLYHKPEGYLSAEKILYRGGFKFGLFHGHGTLYWPATEVIQYVGRFSKGQRHGRGLEFSKQGNKVYQGNFHHDTRHGRGEEFSDGQIAYRGEFAHGSRHGFGIAYLGANHRYVGRFENNIMAGLGVYSQPGDRFEGMFYNNKPDGPGSHYQTDTTTGKLISIHALWQQGRKVKDSTTPFVPSPVDLPDDTSETMLSAMAADEEKILKDIERSETIDASNITAVAGTKKYNATPNVNQDWKVIVAKYCRLTQSEAILIGIENAQELGFPTDNITNQQGNLDEDQETNDLTEDLLNEVNGVHFLDFTALFVAYIYINSASKVFEGRIDTTHIADSAPDFEAVYHVVIDAVETYNDNWQNQYKIQEEKDPSSERSKSTSTPVPGNQVDYTRKMFMNEREKREEELRRQRAALAAKKGQGQLDIEIEKKIQATSYKALEDELLKLLVDERKPVSDDSKSQPDKLSKQRQSSTASKTQSKPSDEKTKKSGPNQIPETNSVNEFASELLTIIRTARDIMM